DYYCAIWHSGAYIF
nr:immunoglobulin light chain junction region [Macaca mulatta]